MSEKIEHSRAAADFRESLNAHRIFLNLDTVRLFEDLSDALAGFERRLQQLERDALITTPTGVYTVEERIRGVAEELERRGAQVTTAAIEAARMEQIADAIIERVDSQWSERYKKTMAFVEGLPSLQDFWPLIYEARCKPRESLAPALRACLDTLYPLPSAGSDGIQEETDK